MSSDTDYQVIGSRPIRHDGVDKVTGRAQYGADIQFADLLYGKILRSPLAHARVRSIDCSRALKIPGVMAVITSDDFPEPIDKVSDLGGTTGTLSNVLARGKVLYTGHALAAVAATSMQVAEEALNAIDVDYEPLTPVLDVQEAMQDEAVLLHEDLYTDVVGGEKSDRPSNIAKHLQFEMGDVEKGFTEADVIVEQEFTTATVHQGYIEPHNATAFWNADGQLTVWTSTQGAFEVRQQLSDMLHLPVSSVKVVPMEIGGGFGGKISVYLQPVAAVLSRKTGKPVKLVMTRQEVFEATGPTPASYIRVKMGARQDGTITAATAWMAYEAGAFPGSPIAPGCMCVFAPYAIENGLIDGFDVVVNKPKTNAYRAPGATNAAFASETVVDEICQQLDMDPLEFREKNAAHEGGRRIDGPVWPRIGCMETVQSARKHPHYQTPLEGPNRGRGVATGFWFNAGLQSSVHASVNTDGTVNLVEGSTDIGGTRASIAMQMAEVLGIAAEDVHPSVVDTDSVGYTAVTGGSRTTFATGHAAFEAAIDIKQQMMARAALIWEVESDQILFDKGVFSVTDESDRSFTFQELAAQLDETGGSVIGRASVNPPGVGGAFCTNIVDVEVDIETGKVEILRFTVLQDAGKAIHPAYVEGQMQGGSVQGIGWALNEEYCYDEKGRMLNSSLLDYRLPTSLDLPMIDTEIIEVPNPGHPFGVRGVGEVPIVPPPAAIANAIFQATGIRMKTLPMNPARMLERILEASQ